MTDILITGAGFTANFGAPLAKHIYESIFNNKRIRAIAEIESMLLESENIALSNYENLYQKVTVCKKLSETQKETFREEIWSIFLKEIHAPCKNPIWSQDVGIEKEDQLLEEFFIKFCCTDTKSVIFTLNQDLFIERILERVFPQYNKNSNPSYVSRKLQNWGFLNKSQKFLKRAGIKENEEKGIPVSYADNLKDYQIKINDSHYKEAKQDFEEWENGNSLCLYVKLHGSMDFLDCNGRPIIIAGENKIKDINSNELTKFYMEKFEDIVNKNNCRVFIIGYGFQDKHINKILNLSTKHSNNEYYLIEKQSLHEFLQRLEKNRNGLNIKRFKKKLKLFISTGITSRNLKNKIIPFFNPNSLSTSNNFE